jgi:hypothetical protein
VVGHHPAVSGSKPATALTGCAMTIAMDAIAQATRAATINSVEGLVAGVAMASQLIAPFAAARPGVIVARPQRQVGACHWPY